MATLTYAKIVQKCAQNVQKCAEIRFFLPILAKKCVFDPCHYFSFLFQKWIPPEKLDKKHLRLLQILKLSFIVIQDMGFYLRHLKNVLNVCPVSSLMV